MIINRMSKTKLGYKVCDIDRIGFSSVTRVVAKGHSGVRYTIGEGTEPLPGYKELSVFNTLRNAIAFSSIFALKVILRVEYEPVSWWRACYLKVVDGRGGFIGERYSKKVRPIALMYDGNPLIRHQGHELIEKLESEGKVIYYE
jgi:hypothetical protein